MKTTEALPPGITVRIHPDDIDRVKDAQIQALMVKHDVRRVDLVQDSTAPRLDAWDSWKPAR